MSPYSGFKIIVIALAICSAVTSHALAQGVEVSKPIVVNGASYEDSKTHLDFLAERAGDDKLIIMIARLGDGESARNLNRRRLRTARSHQEIVRAIPRERIVIAEGESVRGSGRIEVYLDGKLLMVFLFGKNKDFAKEP
jgi:hypothetical protein